MIRKWAKIGKDAKRNGYQYPVFEQFTNYVIDQVKTVEEPLMQLVSQTAETKSNNKDNKQAKT